MGKSVSDPLAPGPTRTQHGALTPTRADRAALRREQVLTLFAMTDLDAAGPNSLAPADRAALAQALAAVRLSTLLPPTGFLTAPSSSH